ncbi:hypothetical protein A3F03_03415 [Candidatus Roizmanbacteria bacterium RIFCSPHIGHO2_12_FULL_41_11]|uniref:Purine nucleoside phosphorylase n=3 Tax=Candidatus Roizmaniibacteriota TaxID=1752723 RepID=A0A1F7J7P0_9BACT|nr:MAG: hypothetical protein A3F03_03415 [Candidatus Roizmanbacteria bacterium RIFCSPHIGHO2_12_FULL_41_11]OGK51616.1 MAG: hypothetical protein A2966_01055 [Candidatus Roizmanbacteria bacterium RIFCSPLOWO2_01_FULL_41_22]
MALFIKDKSVIAGFTNRHELDGRKVIQVIQFLKRQPLHYRHLVIPVQTHSSNTVIVEESDFNEPKILKINNCDGLITKLTGVILTVLTADCLPLIFIDRKQKIIGISHQGWQGTLQLLPAKMVKAMEKLGSQRDNLEVYFGPSIGSCCYDISEDRARLFQKKFSSNILRKSDTKTYLNLSEANRQSLLRSAITKGNIYQTGRCTSCKRKQFYSFRRDKKIVGEMLSFVVIT